MKRVALLSVCMCLVCFPCISAKETSKLFDAVVDENLAKVQKLVEKGADINEESVGMTPLERAARGGNLDIVIYLVSKGGKSVDNAFDEAMNCDHYDIAKYLVSNGLIEPNNNASAFYGLLDNKKKTIDDRISDVKDIAGDKLTSPEIVSFVEPENYKKVIDSFHINLLDKCGHLGNSILHVAAYRNNPDLVAYLIKNGFNINVINNNNQTALFYAITKYGPSINWQQPIIETADTAKINFISDMPYYRNPEDVQQRQVAVVMSLLDAKINVNQQDTYGWTVLHYASAAYPQGLQELNRPGIAGDQKV